MLKSLSHHAERHISMGQVQAAPAFTLHLLTLFEAGPGDRQNGQPHFDMNRSAKLLLWWAQVCSSAEHSWRASAWYRPLKSGFIWIMSDKQLLLTRTQLLRWFLVLPTICCPLVHPHCIAVIVQDEHKVSDATGRKQPSHKHNNFKILFLLDGSY